jgi:threonine/homoserine/homoserine lactone efflux protein
MYPSLIFKCLLIGLINALPAGPAAIVCLRRAIIVGRRAGMVSGLGMALADAVYVIIARAGLGRLPQMVAAQRSRLIPVVGVVVVIVGLNMCLRKQRSTPGADSQGRGGGLLGSAFLLSVTNLSMLVSLPALFAALRVNANGFHPIGIVVTVLSVLGGSIAWWSIATQLIHRSKCVVADQVLKKACALSGIVLIILGFASISSLFL